MELALPGDLSGEVPFGGLAYMYVLQSYKRPLPVQTWWHMITSSTAGQCRRRFSRTMYLAKPVVHHNNATHSSVS